MTTSTAPATPVLPAWHLWAFQTKQFRVVAVRNTERRGHKMRIYISGQPDPDLPTPPYGPKGQNAENDAAWRKYNREELRIMREHVEWALGQLPGRPYAVGDLRFSRKAGCGCGCSPGFVTSYVHAYDLHIEVLKAK